MSAGNDGALALIGAALDGEHPVAIFAQRLGNVGERGSVIQNQHELISHCELFERELGANERIGAYLPTEIELYAIHPFLLPRHHRIGCGNHRLQVHRARREYRVPERPQRGERTQKRGGGFSG